MALITAKPFRLALLQLAGLNASKANNIAVARRAVAAAASSTPKPDLIVLPEVWNSPYAVSAFREYSERVPAVKDGKEIEKAAAAPEGESVTALREMARDAGVWLIGGE
jgi:predicted amidohydrolase